MLQHGLVLGVATNLVGDGNYGYLPSGVPAGVDGFYQWTLMPSYVARLWFDDWVQLTGRVGVGATLSELSNFGFEVGVGAIVKFVAGVGLYAEASFMGVVANDFHPIIGLEGGLVVDYEVMP